MSKISSVVINNEDVNKQNMIASATETNGMANAIKYLSYSLAITKIVAVTISGYAARVVASQMLPQPIIAISNDKNIARSFNIYSGTTGVHLKTKFYRDSLKHLPICLNFLWKNKYITSNDMLLLIALGYPGKGRRMNTLQTHYVKDLIKNFSWK